MERKLANFDSTSSQKSTEKLCEAKNPNLWKALDTIVNEFNITYGTIKIYVHEGKWTPKLEIVSNLYKEISRD